MISNKLKDKFEQNISFQIDFTSNFNKSFRREFQAVYGDQVISADEFAILFTINFEPNITQSELAKLLFKGKAHVGKILNDMEEKGVIKRVAATQDNIIIKKNIITPKGEEIFKEGFKHASIFTQKLQEEFPPDEMKQFIEYLHRYRNVLNTIVDVKLK